MEQNEQKISNKNFLDAFVNALKGIWHAIKTQTNIKIQIIVTILVMIAGAIFKFNTMEFVFLVFSCGLVLIAEMINTAIEETVNLVTLNYHPLAKIAKDVGAGSVLVAALNAVIVGCILFLGKIF